MERHWIHVLCAGAVALGCAGCGQTAGTASPAKITEITVWTYYNDDQLESFNQIVDTFNETVGKEKGIHVSSYSQGSVNDLEINVVNSAEGKVGADPLPNIFSGYADTAYTLERMGLVVDLSPYFTQEERDAYFESYLTEGDFDGDGSIKIFPTAKSTEVLFLNDTDWQPFAQANGASYEDLATIEGVVETAQRYYDWTDAQTDAPDDGKALFGRDAMANYMLIGARELGCTIFDVRDGAMTLHFDEDVARALWDNYYVPFVKGWFSAVGHYRSDDVKTGNILAYVGSSSSGSFFPDQVMTSDTESHDIELKALPCPDFRDGKKVAVQQGAGMVVTKGTDDQIAASVEFLKWSTAPENNISFSVSSGYLPVTHEAADMETIRASAPELSPKIEQVLSQAVQEVESDELYTTRAFAGGKEARAVLEYAMSDQAEADRAVVTERLAQGQSLDEAAAEFLTDAHFQSWYQDLKSRLEAYQG
ncbi:extracellular solute-binding protein [Pseudoflavonifractor sp. MSJ-37]|uniref:extracellular solute-binding protein n=1 Tax=Pseudoflavonifractor sp. MSJ-37 TaxID=2841531 RepID=UPI001C0F478B|nr:extracellular solute-binding protein [Pseudoflavonifractor sp. MSJ-37]MBU5435595.1 extracellular solute-binding protein [Pseudoflavonifractor sp. MSJ-37]